LVELTKNCPICGREMEKGYVTCTVKGLMIQLTRDTVVEASLLWSKEKYTSEGAETLAEDHWGHLYIRAYRCSSCELVFFPYGERAKKLGQEETEELCNKLLEKYKDRELLENKIRSVGSFWTRKREERIYLLAKEEGLLKE